MTKELYLPQFHCRRELNDNLLGVLAELGTLPTFRVDSRVQKFCDREFSILPRAVNDSVFKLDTIGVFHFV
jgi:hypothetical protein